MSTPDAVTTAKALKTLRERNRQHADVPTAVLEFLIERLIDQTLEEHDGDS